MTLPAVLVPPDDPCAPMVERLERMNTDLEEFACFMSHDLQEPLRTIAGFADLIALKLNGHLDPEAKEWIGQLTAGCRRLAKKHQDFLDYMRAATRNEDDLADVMGPFDLHAALDEAIEAMWIPIRETDAKIIKIPALWPRAYGSAPLITQVFQNLISNSLKYRRTRPEIRVTVTVRDRAVIEVAFADNGIGFQAAHAETIFKMGKRLHPDDGTYSGSGFGLAMCRRIIDEHHGRIWAEGDTGKGATIRFQIPAATQ